MPDSLSKIFSLDNAGAWIFDPSDSILMVAASILCLFVVFGICTRLGRLRSLSQMTGFDFAVNVAIGSILASAVLSPDPSIFRASVALGVIFALQVGYSTLRRRVPFIGNPSSQSPHILFIDNQFIEENMRATKFTRNDIHHAMRTSQINSYDEIRFIIAEPTGDVSIYKGGDGKLSPEIFEGVIGAERLMKGGIFQSDNEYYE